MPSHDLDKKNQDSKHAYIVIFNLRRPRGGASEVNFDKRLPSNDPSRTTYRSSITAIKLSPLNAVYTELQLKAQMLSDGQSDGQVLSGRLR